MPSLLPRNMLLIARREYLEQIRGRAFRLSTILVPLLVIFLLGVSTVTGRKLAAHRHIAIAADNPALAADIRSDLTQEKRAGYTADVVAPFTAQDRADLQARVANKSLDGLLVVENSSGGTPSVTYISQSSGDLMSTSRLEDAVDHGFLNLRLAQQGVPAEKIASLAKPVHLDTLLISGSGQTGKSQGMTPFYKAMLMTFLMTMPILLYGMDMARSIIEEKSSRIFEVMLAVARPDDLLTGKLLGVGAVGLTQIAIWIAAATLLSGTALMGSLVSGNVQLHFSPLEAVLFPVYFVLGFLLFSSLFAGLAATCENEQELQMYTPLAAAPTWLSFGMILLIVNDSNSFWPVVASLFPPTAPIVMFLRMASQTPPVWQFAVSILLLILGIWGTLWFSSRLYRVGILMYGKRATLPELLRWLRYS